MATATEIAEDEGKSPKSYNSAVGQLGKRIAKHMGLGILVKDLLKFTT